MFVAGDKLEDGHYTVVKEIGQGGMGVVYHCRDEILQRDVAIKMLLPELMTKQDTVEVFREEARLAAQLEHPNIVTIYQVGTEDRKGKIHHYIAMEYLPGGNLAGRIASKQLSVEHALNWMKQLATGLNFAHKRNVVHQDIKADNIFITLEGDLKIGDFGLARIAAGRMKRRTSHGMGTPAYMSPEICRGEAQDHRSDIYSMGILFFEMATGQLPYKSKGMIEMAMKHASAPIPSARKLNAALPETLDQVIQRMMAKTPEDRFQTMAEVLSILDDLIFELRVARLGLSHKPRVLAKPFGQPGGSLSTHPTPAKSFASLSSFIDKATDDVSEEIAEAPAADSTKDAGTAIKAHLETAPTPKTEPAAAVQPPASAVVPAPSPVVADKEAPAQRLPTADRGAATVEPAVGRRTEKSPEKHLSNLQWTFPTHGPIGWGAGPTMSRDESVIYVGSSDGVLYALAVASGQELWSFETNGPIISSPLVLTDKIVVASGDGKLYAVSSQGKGIWKYKSPSAFASTPCAYQDTVIAATVDGNLLAIDATLGILKWQFEARGGIVSAVHQHASVVYFGSRDGSLYAVTLSNGKLKWKFDTGGPIVAPPAVSTDNIYVGSMDGTLYAVDTQTGRICWDYATSRPIMSGGVIVFTSVIFCSQDKWMYCCEKYDGRLMWKAPLKGRVVANLVSHAGNIILVTREGWMQSFQARNGALNWQIDAGQRLEAPPLSTAKQVFVGSVSGELMAFSV